MDKKDVLYYFLVANKTQSWIRKAIRTRRKAISNKLELGVEIDRLKADSVEVITYFDSLYPDLLREISDYPPVLFCRGNMSLLSKTPKIAIVGSRKSTKYGEAISKKLADRLSVAGCTIVSGLAFGIDSMAHLGSYRNPGKTIAVLGTPINEIYPRSNKFLVEKILRNDGLIISENAPDSKIDKYCFPLRNRIIAGLCEATVVVEAAEKSGSLITANLAAEYNRYVYAVPGNIDRLSSRGANELISRGATCLNRFDIILEDLGFESQGISQGRLTETELKILECIKAGSNTIDKISSSVSLDIPKLHSIITEMELRGIVRKEDDVVIFD